MLAKRCAGVGFEENVRGFPGFVSGGLDGRQEPYSKSHSISDMHDELSGWYEKQAFRTSFDRVRNRGEQ
jgi:hypothetical protein